jgi:hypothetical protein
MVPQWWLMASYIPLVAKNEYSPLRILVAAFLAQAIASIQISYL